jgi:pyruvate-ferredoxin/flavodoxin oxidoreductase
MNGTAVTWDGNEATASVAYRCSEVISIYPITPASPMGEHADAWAAAEVPNLWGDVPAVVEMQSEGGAAGAVHGALQAGAMTTTFTASQGLLLMIPNMFKIAGELTSAVIHVAARSVACQALSIFGDHSDVYAARGTGFAMLASASVQEAHDMALVAHSASLRSRVPFLHFFDGFRTSHEIAKTERLQDDDLLALLDPDAIAAHRGRALTPENPQVRGTAQNPDVFFQAREAVNPFYDVLPEIVERTLNELGERTGRTYRLFDYVGHPEAERVVVLMGSGAETVHETVEWMVARGEKVGLVKVRLYRPFSARHLLEALPSSVQVVGVLDRTKEPGAPGEPLFLDVVAGLNQARLEGREVPWVVGGRYGLSSKEFTPAMVCSVFGMLADRPLRHGFTVGIHDDVTGLSLPWDPDLDIESEHVTRAVFYGLGSDGTVGANKNSIKIIGGETSNFAQGYFVYDSKKSGAATISHLRFGPDPIRSAYLISSAGFVGCHQWGFLDRFDVLSVAAPGAVFLLNSPHPPDRVWGHLNRPIQEQIIRKGLTVYVIDAHAVAQAAGMGRRTNTVMQTCFFALSGVLPREEAIEKIKGAITKTYGRKGDHIVQMNHAVVDAALDHLHRLEVPSQASSERAMPPVVSNAAPDFVKRVTAKIMARQGDQLPVSCFPPDGTWPSGTTQWEKRGIAREIPIWDPDLCIQCNKCALVCPHAAIRVKVFDTAHLEGAPEGYPHIPYRGGKLAGQPYVVQVAPEDCTGCTMCAVVCPAKDKSNPRHKALDMLPVDAHLEVERERFDFFLGLPEVDRTAVKSNAKETQFFRPLFEFSGACSGCGETPYVKLLTQLFGDRMLIANATGCSSIYGGNLPTTPYASDAEGRGPAWSNSLFEDNAEFGLGFRLAVDQIALRARGLLRGLSGAVGAELADALDRQDQHNEEDFAAARARVVDLRATLAGLEGTAAAELHAIADYLVRKSVWIVGGDGWAYDIGYGGLDHALASGRDINILVLDTEVYSNTGGQQSKATPMAAVAKFAAGGKGAQKKDLGLLAMAYGNVYVAQIACGAKDTQTATALLEAEAYPGPSLVIAYSPCIAHGYNIGTQGLQQQKLAVSSGYWPLYRFDPRRTEQGAPAMRLDSRAPSVPVREFAYTEARFRMLLKSSPDRAKALMAGVQDWVEERFVRYTEMAAKPKDGGA